MEQEDSSSTRNFREEVRGQWLHPGQDEAYLTLCGDGQVIYEKNGLRTEKQGQWQKYHTGPGAHVLEVTFHHKGTNEVALLKQHLLYELCPGMWRAQDQQQIFIVEKDFDGTPGLWREGHERMLVPPELKAVGKHIYCWMHPGRKPAILVLTSEGEIIYVDQYADPAKAPGVANGKYEYDVIKGEEQWFTYFHYLGGPNKVTTRLRRCSASPVWRAFGDGDRDYAMDNYELAEWHIVMFQIA